MPRSETAEPRAAARPVAQGAAGLLLATSPARDGAGPAAALALEATTVLGRLLDQLATLGLRSAWVLTRPEWRDAIEAIAARTGLDARVVASADLAEDLRTAAELAGAARGTLLVARADVICHREALAGLLADPRIASGILIGPAGPAARWAYRVRGARRRIVAAASPFHSVRTPNGYFLGFLKVDGRDRGALADAAGALAALADDRPAAWADELARKQAEWRLLEGDGEAALHARAAGEDAVALLLTGLVRADVRLGSARVREFYFSRPASDEDVRRSLRELEGIDEDRVALDSAVKALDGFFTTFLVSPYSKHIARFCARRGWTPNQMTSVSMAIGIAAAVAFATGSRAGMVAGAVLLQAAFTVDCVDGQLARYTRTFSTLGAWLDSVFDRAKEYLVFAGLALGASHGFDQDVWALAAAALTLQTARHIMDFSFAARVHAAIDATAQMPLAHVADAPAPDDPEEDPPLLDDGVPGTGPDREERAPVRLARRGLRALAAVDRSRAGAWAKRIVVLPIGERFALISITAALFTPRTTFVALIAWGGFAAAYGMAGRILRSVAR